jgi:hypothetical protein
MLVLRRDDSGRGGGAPILMQPEAERLVEDLKPIKLEEVGSMKWTQYHQTLEKLNMQAQLCVMHQADEFVVEVRCIVICMSRL